MSNIRQKQVFIDKDIFKLSSEDRQALVDAFVWLINEDKKQNPGLYSEIKGEQAIIEKE